MSVLLPSSTEPAVATRSIPEWRTSSESAAVAAGRWPPPNRRCGRLRHPSPSEVALALAVLHRGLRGAVVGARLAALGDPRGGDLRDHLLDRARRGLDAAG